MQVSKGAGESEPYLQGKQAHCVQTPGNARLQRAGKSSADDDELKHSKDRTPRPSPAQTKTNSSTRRTAS